MKLRKKCLKLWGKIIIAAAKGRCERCPKEAKNGHHIITRGTSPNPMWLSLENGVALCIDCHINWAHSTDFDRQLVFNQWVREHLKNKGLDYEVLKIKAKARGSLSMFDYEIIFKELSKKLNIIMG